MASINDDKDPPGDDPIWDQRQQIGGVYTCVRAGCNLAAMKGKPYCRAHEHEFTEEKDEPVQGIGGTSTVVAEKLKDKVIERSPVESDAIHLLKQAVRRLENGDRQNAERYVATACVLMGIGVDLNQP